MTVSLCIIAYNEEKTLKSLFCDLCNQTYSHEKIEIVLVNAMSTDKTRELMDKFAEEDNGFKRVTVLDNPKKTQATGWNVAIRAAKEDVIIRIDAHTMIPADFVKKNITCLEKGEFVSGGPRPNVVAENTPWQQTLLLAEESLFGSGIAPYRRKHHSAYVKSVFHGAYRREVFEKAGFFDEQLGRTEDNEMNYRIRKAGYKIYYDSDIISYQHIRNTWRGMLKQKYGNGMWVGLTSGICIQCLSIFHFVPFCFVLGILLAVLLFILEIKLPLIVLTVLYGLINLIMTFVACKGKKKYIQYLTLPFLFLSLHLAYGVGTIFGMIKMPLWRKKYWENKDKI